MIKKANYERRQTMKKILIIEDEKIIRNELKSLLENSGYEVLIIEKFDNVKENIKNMKFDLILMDIQMPKMDGYSATKAIRLLDRADASGIPIIAMTANAFEEDIWAARRAGMNGHLSKPVNIEKLKSTLINVLNGNSAD